MNKASRLMSFFRSSAARLALSYLAILMLLSISFSVLMYVVSTGLQVNVQIYPEQATTQPIPQSQTVGQIPGGSPSIAKLNAEIKQRIAALKWRAIKVLSVVNAAVFVAGAILCYYLARRTLRPIERAAEAQSRFASDASHELRTPLTVMQSEIEYVLHTLDLPARAQAALQSNLEEITQLRELSDGLLRLARDVEALPVEPVWIDEVAAKAVRSVIKPAKNKAIAMDTAVPHIQAVADAPSLAQAIGILLDNAITYSPPKSTIVVTGTVDDGHTYISVRDQGPGIDKAAIPHVFDRFYRSGQAHKHNPTGHGLGLAIAQRLIEQQHGSITVASKVDQGSTFTVRLPAFKNR
jgi:signal transduction histidine kinase